MQRSPPSRLESAPSAGSGVRLLLLDLSPSRSFRTSILLHTEQILATASKRPLHLVHCQRIRFDKRIEACTQPYHGIDFEREIELEERIGSGAFGSVYRGRWQGAPVAVKIMQNVGSGAGSDIVDSFTQEVKASNESFLSVLAMLPSSSAARKVIIHHCILCCVTISMPPAHISAATRACCWRLLFTCFPSHRLLYGQRVKDSL